MASPSGRETGLEELSISSDRFSPVVVAPRMRNRYTPVHVAHEVETVRLAAVPRDPEAVLTIEGNRPGRIDVRTKIRIEAFLDMLRAR